MRRERGRWWFVDLERNWIFENLFRTVSHTCDIFFVVWITIIIIKGNYYYYYYSY